MAAIYRVRQFIRALGARSRMEDESVTVARPYLPAAAAALFQVMPRYDRRHSVSVFHTLRQRGHHDPDLLAAALLHDAGKSQPQDVEAGGALRLWHRVAVVLLRAADPGLLVKLGEDRPGSWRRPFWVQLHHAEISAKLAQVAGCSETTVELIRHHELESEEADRSLSPQIRSLLQALQAADSEN